MAQMLADVEILRTLPRQVFWPARHDPQAPGGAPPRETGLAIAPVEFGRFLHAVFSYRRKTLRKAIAEAGFNADEILSRSGFDGQARRAEEFAPADFMTLFCAAQLRASS